MPQLFDILVIQSPLHSDADIELRIHVIPVISFHYLVHVT